MTTACKLKSVSALVPLTATKDINYFTNRPYAVINVHHRDKTFITPMRTGASPGGTVEFEVPKVVDYFGRIQLQTTFDPWTTPAPVTAAADPCFVEGAGFRLIDNIQVNYTNKRLTSSTVPYWWAVLLNMFNRDISYRAFNSENQGVSNNLASDTATGTQLTRNRWLLDGYTFLSEIESGYQHHSRENYVMISVLSSRLIFKITLAPTGALVQGFTGTPSNQPAAWINNQQLIMNTIHLNPHERKRELDRHEEGIFNLIRVFTVQTDVIPAASTSYTLNLNMTSAYEVVFFIFKPTHQLAQTALSSNDPVVAMDAVAASPKYYRTINPQPAVAGTIGYYTPSYVQNGALIASSTSYAMPTEWEFRLQNNPIVNRERTWLNLTVDRQHHFPGCVVGPNAILCLHLGETFQHDNNAILGHVDFNTASQRQAIFYWTNGSQAAITNTGAAPFPTSPAPGAAGTAGDSLTCITIACGPDFIETIQGQAHAIFGI